MTRTSRLTKLAATALLALGLGGCSLGARTFEVRGQVLGIDRDHPEVLLKHEDVPGLMSAMTMPFRVRDRSVLEGLSPGDLVTGELVIRGADAYLARLNRVGSAPIEPDLATINQSSGVNLLRAGDAVPPAKFVDQTGRGRTFEAWRGKAAVVTFIYTRCPMPTFCPMMDRHFAAIQGALKRNSALRGQVHLISISFDPEHDTPDLLAAHADKLGADPATWTFLTGEPDEIEKFSARFGISVTRERDAPGTIIHNLRTAVIDRRGNVVKLYSGADWTPEQVLADLDRVTAGS